ncbi:MAG: hypothetical protein RIM99_04565 [Cyclobacteriaceae bacterium]
MILRLIACYIFLGAVFLAKSDVKKISQADSLFDQQKYTEAFDVYETIFLSGQASASMLLRMAFIKDGLGNYVDALYYLDLYYKKSADKSVVVKIEELSSEKNLSGYQYDDSDFFRAVLHKHQQEFQLVLLALTILLTAYIFRKRKQNERPVTATVFQLILLVSLIFVSNNLFEEKKGIISQNSTLLRSGPSAGADPVELVGKGHKVDIIDRTLVWTKIRWNGEDVYVRNGKIRII